MNKRPFLPIICLFLASSLFAWRGLQAQEATPPPVQAAPTPTIDRLAPPPTVASPTQADEGAYLFWLNCQPCHGDRGQGLTDEWRAQYPEEDQNCWNSGCHGKRPYDEGFTLPDTVPAVIGAESLARFQTVGQLYAYIRAAMPYEYPGTLPDDEYLAMTAFLARENGFWNGTRLTESDAHQIRLRPAPAEPAPLPPAADPAPGTPPVLLFMLAGLAALLAGVGGLWVWRRRTP